MVDTIHPVNAVTGAPSYSGRMLRQAASALHAGATAARPLGGRSGVRPGTPASTVTATSTTWTVQPFAGSADVETAAEASIYDFAFDAVATGPVTAADATYPRSDLIYVQIDDPAESDGSTVPAATRKYVAGTPGATPSDPPLPVTRAFTIARINVPIAGGGSPTVTWLAPYAVAAGAPIPVSSKAEGDALPSIPMLQRIRLDKGRVETYFDATLKPTAGWYQTGGNPLTFTPVLSNGWVDAAFAAYGPPIVTVNGGRATAHLIIKSGTTAASTLVATFPVGCRPVRTELPWGSNSAGSPSPLQLQLIANGSLYAVSVLDATYTFLEFVYDVAEVPVAD